MKKLKEYKGIIIIALVLILGTFYWFGFRPYLIKKSCMKEALPINYADPVYNSRIHLLKWNTGADKVYEICLKRKGL